MPFVKVRRAQHDDDFETWDSGRPAPTLNAMDNTGDTYATVLIPMAFSAGNSAKARSIAVTEEVTPPLRAGASGTNQVPTIMVPTTFSLQPDDRGGFPGALRAVQTDVAPTIAVGDHHSDRGLRIVDPNIAVRRLTPLECERLMGWPDGWTAEGINGPIADSHRFRMCGNGVVASVSEWIGRRLPEATQ